MNKNLRKMLKDHRRGCTSKNFHDHELRQCSCGRDKAEVELARLERVEAQAAFIVLNRNNFTDKHPLIKPDSEYFLDKLAESLAEAKDER